MAWPNAPKSLYDDALRNTYGTPRLGATTHPTYFKRKAQAYANKNQLGFL